MLKVYVSMALGQRRLVSVSIVGVLRLLIGSNSWFHLHRDRFLNPQVLPTLTFE